MLLIFAFAFAFAQKWFHASQPHNLACLDINDTEVIANIHETVFDMEKKSNKCSNNSWNTVFLAKGNNFQGFNQCGNGRCDSSNCQVQNYKAVTSNIADTSAKWDSLCGAVLSPLKSVGHSELTDSGSFADLSLFARAPGQLLRVHKYAKVSDCKNQEPLEVLLYPIYNSCTSMGKYFILSILAGTSLTQEICSDENCLECASVEVKYSRTACTLLDGYRYRAIRNSPYISPRIGYFDQQSYHLYNLEDQSTTVIIVCMIGLTIVLCVFGFAYHLRGKKLRKESELFQKKEFISMIASHAEKNASKYKDYSDSDSSSSICMADSTVSVKSVMPPNQLITKKHIPPKATGFREGFNMNNHPSETALKYKRSTLNEQFNSPVNATRNIGLMRSSPKYPAKPLKQPNQEKEQT
jgi:predicted enzyme related to lactoylglutathione lyase